MEIEERMLFWLACYKGILFFIWGVGRFLLNDKSLDYWFFDLEFVFWSLTLALANSAIGVSLDPSW
jgi:hypothetical protein